MHKSVISNVYGGVLFRPFSFPLPLSTFHLSFPRLELVPHIQLTDMRECRIASTEIRDNRGVAQTMRENSS